MPFEGVSKQHMNLTRCAYDILWQDIRVFGFQDDEKPTGKDYDKERVPSGFLNQIFKNFYKSATASCGLKGELLKKEIKKYLEGKQIAVKKDLLNIIADGESAKWKKLQEKQKEMYGKSSVQFKFTLNTDNFNYLNSVECPESKYYSDRGEYLVAVFEEYAHLNYVQREKIYFADWIEKIYQPTTADEFKTEVKIKLRNGDVLMLSAYAILPDIHYTANYVVGVTKRCNTDEEKKSHSYRLSNIVDVVESEDIADIPGTMREEIRQDLAKKGAAFIGIDSTQALVRLTPEGVRLYDRGVVRHLRPDYISCENNIYCFDCPEFQIEQYFKRFGGEAVVLSPEKLHNTLRKFFAKAAKAYDREINSQNNNRACDVEEKHE